jgi:hypothetical protein
MPTVVVSPLSRMVPGLPGERPWRVSGGGGEALLDGHPAGVLPDEFRDKQDHYLRERDRGRCGSLLNPRTIYR